MPDELTDDEDRVLRFLYDFKEDGEVTSERISAGTGLPLAAVSAALNHLRELRFVSGTDGLLQNVMAALKEMDEKFKPTDAGYAEHVLLLASAVVGAKDSFLANELGYEPEFVATVGSRLRSAGIWRDDELNPSHKVQWEKEFLSFYCDGAVATGDLVVVGGTPDNPQYQMTPGGAARAAKLIKNMSDDGKSKRRQ